MRKIPHEFENPIDNLILDVVERIMPIFKYLHFTPNTLTTISFILGIWSIHLMHNDRFKEASIVYFISYVFDCCDGHYARKYNMISTFGDYYDHFTDVVIFVGIMYTLFVKQKQSGKNMGRYACVVVIFGALCLYHVSCQEGIHNKQNHAPTLSHLSSVCENDTINKIKYSRFFGCGTFTLVTCWLIYTL